MRNEGVTDPKPLVKVRGERLVDRLIRIFMDNGAEEIDVICNDLSPLVADHMEDIRRRGLGGREVPLRYVVKSTPSSMHSLFELSPLIGDAPFVLTTVDTVFNEDDFAEYVKAFREMVEMRPGPSFPSHGPAVDGLMGVTDFIDDEKPLYVVTDEKMNITAFLDRQDHPRWISAGIYGLTAPALLTLRRCVERGEARMRNFQRALISDGLHLRAHAFSKVVDIDHKEDIEKAPL